MNRGLIILLIILLVLTCSFYFFFSYFNNTGGAGLSRIVINYLIPNLPDKKYGWLDFTDRGLSKNISGFYAGRDTESFSMWTLSGLKKFYHRTGTSVYTHRDTCAVYNQLKKSGGTEKSAINDKTIFFDIFKWNQKMKNEYFVTVLRLSNENGKDMVDKVWSTSGKYKVLGQLEDKVCE